MQDDIVGKLEFPEDNVVINDTVLLIQGYAFSKSNKEIDIRIYVNGKLRKDAKWRFARFDVFRIFGTESSYESGFLQRIELPQHGNHSIRIWAEVDNSKKEIGNVSVIKEKPFLRRKERFFQPVPAGTKWPRSLDTQYLAFFTEHANLKPEHRVLEVGPGMGRITLLLTKFLTSGEYFGLEVVPRAVQYCRENISSRYPNFHFELAQVYNKAYNPEGKYKSSNYQFPFDNESFDCVILSSVFTHLILPDMKNYLKEVSRVMKRGGHCYVTFVLLNKNTLERLEKQETQKTYDYKFDGYRVRDEKIPEKAVAYEENLVKKLFAVNNLEIKSIHYGKWAGFKDNLTVQDIVIGRKK